MSVALPAEAHLEALYPEGHQVATLRGYHPSADAHAGPGQSIAFHDSTPVRKPTAAPRSIAAQLRARIGR